ncbi:MAG TPA: hypothetical protein VIL19_02080 [Casimicrobiaceae bacterium]
MTDPGAHFLVVVRAGDTSLHPKWTENVATRDWDLVVSYFGDDPLRFRDDSAVRVDDKGQKLGGLHALFMRDDFWRTYDYIWLPDDDLAITQAGVSELFGRTRALDLALTQPALSWDSYWSHRITLHHPGFRVRMTNFVEVMAPCFARSFLERCLPTFLETVSGWGIDLLWPRLLPARPRRCAIIDAVQMTHTRAVGGGQHYDRLRQAGVSAHEELDAVLARHGIAADSQSLVYAAIDGDGRMLDASDARDALLLRERLDADRAAFAAYDAQRAAQRSEHHLRG